MISFAQLKIGDKARILGFKPCDPAYRVRLLSMGLTTGTTLEVSKIAPLGDPLEIKIRGFYLSLRRQEANIIELEPVV